MNDLEANLKRVLDELGLLDRAALYDIIGLREMGLIPIDSRAGVITESMLRRASGLFDDERE